LIPAIYIDLSVTERDGYLLCSNFTYDRTSQRQKP
jgi:hypothetical protein